MNPHVDESDTRPSQQTPAHNQKLQRIGPFVPELTGQAAFPHKGSRNSQILNFPRKTVPIYLFSKKRKAEILKCFAELYHILYKRLKIDLQSSHAIIVSGPLLVLKEIVKKRRQ